MACANNKRIDRQAWPLYRETDTRLCAYKIEAGSQAAVAHVAAMAETMQGYVKRGQFFVTPNGVRVYVYFDPSMDSPVGASRTDHRS